jgi:hypothetical protein
MARVSCMLGLILILILGASPLVVPSAAQIYSPKSEVVRDCDDIAGCVPDTTSLVVVYVFDAAGGAVADMTIAVLGESNEPGGWSVLAVSGPTDRAGMAAVSVRPGQSYSIRITKPGWIPFISETKRAVAGRTQLFRVVMREQGIICNSLKSATPPMPRG